MLIRRFSGGRKILSLDENTTWPLMRISPEIRSLQTGDAPQQCCLAAAARPKKNDDLVVVHNHVDVVDRTNEVPVLTAIGLCESPDFDPGTSRHDSETFRSLDPTGKLILSDPT